MQCPSGHEIPTGSKFCPTCGVAVDAARCPNCDAPLISGARFCAACGTPVSDTATRAGTSGIDEELRQITAVFCDLVGSTELSTKLDPEEFGDVVKGYQQRVGAVVERYAGNVDKYLGDGVLVEFGWPHAHDDDAQRAVLAGLAIVEEIGNYDAPHPLAVRVGIHTGPVLVGEMGSEGHTEMTALGETMNRAARLQGCAAPGAVVVSDSTLKLVRGIFVVEDIGPQQLQGISEPVTAHRVLRRSGVRSKLAAAGDRLTPFIGRERELELVVDHWHRAQNGDGQTLLLSGQPGIGKSRLIYELRERLADSPHTWLETSGTSYTQHSAFRPASQLIEQAIDTNPGDGPQQRLDKLRAGLEAANVGDPDALPLIAQLLSIPTDESATLVMSAELTRRRTIEVLARWVLGLSEQQPLVLLLEDLHWCDASTLELFEQLILQGSAAALMLVGTARPELVADWKTHPRLTTLELSPFNEDETRELLRTLASGRDLPGGVMNRVVNETDGIPLFAEEMGRMILESDLISDHDGELSLTGPVEDFEIPTTLQDSLMARLDRLSTAKRVAQLASAIGREFDYGLIEEIAELEPNDVVDGLERLVEDDLIFADGEPPDANYVFKHALIQDAAYRSMLKRSRVPLHRSIANAIERREGGAGVSPEVLARHWEAGDEPTKAIAQYKRAADAAARQSAHQEAIEHLRRAIRLTEDLPDDAAAWELEVDLQVPLGASIMAIRGFADPEIEAAYDRARTLCDQLGQGNQVGYTLIGLAIFYINSGQLDRGAELAEVALRIAERDDDDALRLLGHVQLSIPLCWQGRYAEAADHSERARAIYDRTAHGPLAFRYGTDQGVAASCFSAVALAQLGFPDRALRRLTEATELARSLGNPFDLVYARTLASGVQWSLGDLDAQEESASEVILISDQQGFPDFGGIARVSRAAVRALRDRDQGALEECLEGVSMAGSTGRQGGVSILVDGLAATQRVAGNLDDALGTIDGGLAFAEQTGQPYWDAELLRIKAEILFEIGGGREAEAESALQSAVEIAGAQGNKLHELRARASLTRKLRERGDANGDEGGLRELYSSFTEGFDTAPLLEAAELLGERRGAGYSAANPSSG